ncbi:L-threonylcarbamoyladenylate synthase [Acidiluteibacter ferrifornacis]|jgi:L-threonylcarbamoyladenylate synthase|uniref:L-threonylcarbamoyladenylate synthase n=1 Tax=Acidiluteibacter ferrifornacis TaxID=2692424 RepID=A0A6N9NPG0_9FLAO|nr:L-threonylcarbamoyladenylate synthase [Acidiluteibacter ferrifornacis]MBR9831187.1 threonylcarbamoyl-AMP synthase [bacterium]NBG67007.1 threonylcarbamoyl-AMP synthase [Acidiluteibacter ferrifornacis]
MMRDEVEKAYAALQEGKTILYPTDTVWGIGCDATNENAVKRIFEIKQREESKSLIVLVSDEVMLNKYLKDVPPIAWDLIDTAEKPLTIVYPEGKNLAPQVIANDGSVAIRIVKDDFCIALIRRFKKPIISTSANISGEPTPEKYNQIQSSIKHLVDYEVNLPLYHSAVSKPSTIIKLSMNGEFQILRK